jgi:outer membrane receptor protein involved in Fe transport
MRYEIIPNILQTRLAYSTAIGRPAFNQVTAATVVDEANLTITTGNPNLKPTTANNFDFTLEYNPTKDSVFDVDLFDKEFDNYIFTRTVRTVINNQIFEENTFLNSGTAYARGIQLAFEEHLRFLPGPLSGLGFTANYTYTDSKVGLGRLIILSCRLPHRTCITWQSFMRSMGLPSHCRFHQGKLAGTN